MFGSTREELLMRSRDDLVAPGDRGLSRIVAVREEQGAARGRLMAIRKGGETFEVEAVSLTVPGDPPQVWVALHDLAEMRRADEATAALRASNEVLSALTNAAFEAILIHRDGKIVVANHAADAIAGAPPGGLVGKQVF